jgi:class 3 adenylate cyclase
MREAVLAALRRDPDLLPKMTESWREKTKDEDGKMATVVQAAEALEPILADAVSKRPSRLGKLGLKSATLLAGLTADDEASNSRLAGIAEGSQVGIVFVDVAGFTEFTAEKGDDAALELLQRLDDAVTKSIKPVRGECVKKLGDGYLLAFPTGSQAVRGAASLRERVRRSRGSRREFPLQLRIAVHVGEPLVEGDDLLGHDVNITARLLDCAEPDEIVATEAAKETAEKRLKKIAFGNERVVKIRGLAGKVSIYTVNPAESRDDVVAIVPETRKPEEIRSRALAP